MLLQIDPKTHRTLLYRQRRLNRHREQAMQALMAAIVHHLNITTGLVHCTVEKLAKCCGLVTTSETGNR